MSVSLSVSVYIPIFPPVYLTISIVLSILTFAQMHELANTLQLYVYSYAPACMSVKSNSLLFSIFRLSNQILKCGHYETKNLKIDIY